MFTTIVLREVLDNIQQRLMEGGFPLCVPYKFSRTLDFSYSLHKDITKVRQNEKNKDSKFWCGALFSRGIIKPYGEFRRRDRQVVKEIVEGKYADIAFYQTVTTNVTFRVFCSSLDYMETLEEYICTRMIERMYKVDYPNYIDDVEILVHQIEYEGSDQLDTKEFGTIGYVDVTFFITYPVIFDSHRHPVILEINYDLYTSTDSVLLNELQYREDLPSRPGVWKWFSGDEIVR